MTRWYSHYTLHCCLVLLWLFLKVEIVEDEQCLWGKKFLLCIGESIVFLVPGKQPMLLRQMMKRLTLRTKQGACLDKINMCVCSTMLFENEPSHLHACNFYLFMDFDNWIHCIANCYAFGVILVHISINWVHCIAHCYAIGVILVHIFIYRFQTAGFRICLN